MKLFKVDGKWLLSQASSNPDEWNLVISLEDRCYRAAGWSRPEEWTPQPEIILSEHIVREEILPALVEVLNEKYGEP